MACHAEAPNGKDTQWLQILLLNGASLVHLPSPVIRLHRAITLGQVYGPGVALELFDPRTEQLGRYPPPRHPR